MKFYQEGGIHFVTPNILIMDLLYKRVAAHLIRGIMVMYCEKLSDTGTEAFILNIYRQGNKVQEEKKRVK